MDVYTVLGLLDELPEEGPETGRPPAAVAKYLSPMQRVARPPRRSLAWTEYSLLAMLGWTGWSLRYALVQTQAEWWGVEPTSGTFGRACVHLAQAGLWETTNVRLTRTTSLVELTDLGKNLLRAVGIEPVESERVRMERLHRGSGSQRQIRHTAAVCAFAFHARKRGFDTLVCPPSIKDAEPDLLITFEDERRRHYVEVQGRGGVPWRRTQKWRNLYRLQDHVAICAYTPEQAQRYAQEAKQAGVREGYITDLRTLHLTPLCPLWTHHWTGRFGALMPYKDTWWPL